MLRSCSVLCLVAALAAGGCKASGAKPTPSSDAGPSTTAGAEASSGGKASAASAKDPAIGLEQAMKSYLSWTPRQDAPRAISAEIFSLCRLPSLPEQAFTESVHGGSLALRDWANELALTGLKAGGKPAFPVGAAIVKQKLMGADVIALGIMVKQSAGYDPKHGDWAYGYWEKQSGLSSGAEPASACGDCHAGAKTDHVFADESWRMP
jgi:hypothetical protein